MESVFSTLNSVNCNEHTEKKNGLTYLSWAWAWAEVKKRYPLAFYTIYESPEGWNYFSDGTTCWVKTGVTIEGLEHIEYLPVMDFKNKSVPATNVTSTDVNKAVQRSLTKACARHGLGLYIYAGEDLPEETDGAQQPAPSAQPAQQPVQKKQDDKARKAGAMVWKAFTAIDGNKGRPQSELAAAFNDIVARITGGKKGSDLAIDEWQKVAEFVASSARKEVA